MAGSDWNPAKADKDELRDVFGDTMPGTGQRLVYEPKPQEVATFSRQRMKVCADCRSFNHAEGQKRLWKDRRALEIVNEYEWKLQHLGDDPRRMGICSQKDDTLTGPMSLGCDLWRPR